MKGFLLSLVVVIIILGLVLSGCSSSTPASTQSSSTAQTQAGPISLKVATGFPGDTHNMNIVVKYWGDKLMEATGGRVKVTYFFGETLVKAGDLDTAVKEGVADVAHFGTPTSVGRFPVSDVMTTPFLVSNEFMGQLVVNQIYQKGYLKQEFEPFKVLAFTVSSCSYLGLRDKQVMNMDQLKGLKISARSGPPTMMVEALGGAPMSMPNSEIETALQQGVIDGAILNENDHWCCKNKVEKYVLDLPFMAAGLFPLVMNKQKFDSMPADIKVIVEQVSKDAEWYYSNYNTENIGKRWSELQKLVTVYKLSPEERAKWLAASVPIGDKWAEGVAGKGLPSKEALALARIIADQAKW